jgi:transcriptional regulator with XRE-family HTH domain
MRGNFKINLRSELDYRNMTVKELASKTGTAKGALDCYLGKQASMPPADTAARIAAALGVSVEYLVNGEKPMPEHEIAIMSPKKRLILKIFDDLNEENRDFLLAIGKLLSVKK